MGRKVVGVLLPPGALEDRCRGRADHRRCAVSCRLRGASPAARDSHRAGSGPFPPRPQPGGAEADARRAACAVSASTPGQQAAALRLSPGQGEEPRRGAGVVTAADRADTDAGPRRRGTVPRRARGPCRRPSVSPTASVFTGVVAPADIPRWYRIGDVFVGASLSETQGLTFIEAIACGLPLLCPPRPARSQSVVLDGRDRLEDRRDAHSSRQRLDTSLPTTRRCHEADVAARPSSSAPGPPAGAGDSAAASSASISRPVSAGRR